MIIACLHRYTTLRRKPFRRNAKTQKNQFAELQLGRTSIFFAELSFRRNAFSSNIELTEMNPFFSRSSECTPISCDVCSLFQAPLNTFSREYCIILAVMSDEEIGACGGELGKGTTYPSTLGVSRIQHTHFYWSIFVEYRIDRNEPLLFPVL